MDSHPLPVPNTTQSSQDKNNNNQKLKLHAPPPTTTTSPTHEFSFAVSLHNPTPTSAATDLSPADEIFLHGHLLPLRLLSGHLPHPNISPRSSTASLDTSGGLVVPPAIIRTNSPKRIRAAKKSKSFSLFGLPGWKQSGERDDSRKKMKKFSRLVKRYLAMVKKPLISFKKQWRGGEEDDNDIEIYIDRDSSYSFSGQISGGGGSGGRSSNGNNFMKKKQEYSSAPASMRTSPTNSGLLVPVPTMQSDSSSTMEELQAAIQAAIAHCKNSIATADQGGKLVKGLT